MILDILRITMRTTEIKDEDDARQIIDNALATMMHATRCSVNHTLQNSPGELVFRRDMFIDVPVLADLEAICLLLHVVLNGIRSDNSNVRIRILKNTVFAL